MNLVSLVHAESLEKETMAEGQEEERLGPARWQDLSNYDLSCLGNI